MMRVGLFGQFGGGNLGNDGSLEAMLLLLRKAAPEAELVCLCPNPQAIESRFGIRSTSTGHPGLTGIMHLADRFTLGFLRRAVNVAYPFFRARKFDLVIVPGTGFLDDFNETPFGWPFLIFRWSLAARLAGAKLAFVSIGAGPITHPVSKWFMTSSARMCHFRSFRDLISKDFMRTLKGAREYDRISTDLAFKLPPPEIRQIANGNSITVGVGVMSYSGWVRGAAGSAAVRSRYLDRMAAFVSWLLDDGYKVRLLIGEATDETAIRDLLLRLRKLGSTRAASVIFEPARTLTQLMQQIGTTDIVVASRFHNIICALKMHKPVISLGYASKNDALLADMGLHGYSQHIERLDLEVLKRQFTEALSRSAVLRERIVENVARYTAMLCEQDRVLLKELLLQETEQEQCSGKMVRELM